MYFAQFACDALHDLVPFVQFKKHEKQQWRSVTLLLVFFLKFFRLYQWYQIVQSISFVFPSLLSIVVALRTVGLSFQNTFQCLKKCYRSVSEALRTLTNIQDGAFSRKQLSAELLNVFVKKFHPKCLVRLSIDLQAS